jgi:nuclease-like protein
MEAKAAGNPGAMVRRRGFLRERLGGAMRAGRDGAAPAVSVNGAGAKLERCLQGTEAAALHGVPLPDGSRIDSLIVGPAGITVVDTSHYRSKRAHVSPGGLRIGRRNRSDLIYRVLGQVAGLREIFADTPYARVPVEAALVLSDVEGVPAIETFRHPRILIWGTTWVAHQASRPGPLSARQVEALAAYIAGGR